MGACVIDIIAAALMTACYVQGRNHFNDAGITASLGVKAFGFAWGSVACLLFATSGFCCVAWGPGRLRKREYSGTSTRTGRFWRRRNTKAEADVVPSTY